MDISLHILKTRMAMSKGTFWAQKAQIKVSKTGTTKLDKTLYMEFYKIISLAIFTT